MAASRIALGTCRLRAWRCGQLPSASARAARSAGLPATALHVPPRRRQPRRVSRIARRTACRRRSVPVDRTAAGVVAARRRACRARVAVGAAPAADGDRRCRPRRRGWRTRRVDSGRDRGAGGRLRGVRGGQRRRRARPGDRHPAAPSAGRGVRRLLAGVARARGRARSGSHARAPARGRLGARRLCEPEPGGRGGEARRCVARVRRARASERQRHRRRAPRCRPGARAGRSRRR